MDIKVNIDNISWKKKFMFLPVMSSSSGSMIWFKYAYIGKGLISFSINSYAFINLTQTEIEHTNWIIEVGT